MLIYATQCWKHTVRRFAYHHHLSRPSSSHHSQLKYTYHHHLSRPSSSHHSQLKYIYCLLCYVYSPTACTSEVCTSEELPIKQSCPNLTEGLSNREQFDTWCKSCDWLLFHVTTGGVKCASCSQVKRLCLHTEPWQHNEAAFVNATVHGKGAKTLL